jgi:enoyl-CoA hydratase/carnithine racemase
MSIIHARKGAVGWVTLDRPSALNSLSRELLTPFVERLVAWRNDPEVRVVVVTARGRAFCAGADLKATSDGEPGQKDLLDLIVELLSTLRNFPKPVVAAVNGLAVAGGLELVLACDLVIAAESAKFGDAHSNFGVFPGGGGAAVLPRKVPQNVARYLLFTGESIVAAEAKHFGLVNEVVPDGELESRAQALADRLAKKSPLVLANMKAVANEALDKSVADALRHELLMCRNHQRSYDMHEGIRAFVEKREPAFKGY